jgi:hypothetical protein
MPRSSALRHVYWIGGGSGAGKSVTAHRLAASHGLRLYQSDDVMADHGARCTPRESPLLRRFAAMDMDERWVTRSPRVMLETFHWFEGEGFRHIVEDLSSLPHEPAVIAEGFRLLPELVRPLLDDPAKAVWLLPTPAFRLAAFGSRRSMWQIAGRTSDPGRALRNLLERDRLFTERLRAETKRLGLPFIEVDPTMTEDDLVSRVGNALGLS